MQNFIRRHGLAFDLETLPSHAAAFESEMRGGLRGEAGCSLRMLPTYLDPACLGAGGGRGGGRVVVIDAGGTNLRIALVNADADGAYTLSYFEKYPIPGFRQPVRVEDFFDQLAMRLEPIAAQSDQIGFCFSYPAETLPNRDARILAFTKEVDVKGAEGAVVGESLREALKRRGLPARKSVVVVNDTVAAQIGAMAEAGDPAAAGRCIGFILGTGINASYAEKNLCIHKSSVLRDRPGETIIDTESGGYKGFPQGAADRRFIEATIDPERQWLEKMTAGAYQNALLLAWIRLAAAEGMFSPAFADRLVRLREIPIGEADRFFFSPEADGVLAGLCADASDRRKLRALTDAFFSRAAFLAAVLLTAILRRAGAKAEDPARPMGIAAEGATFYNARLLRTRLLDDMDRCARDRMGLQFRFIQAKNATLIGSAAAGLAGN